MARLILTATTLDADLARAAGFAHGNAESEDAMLILRFDLIRVDGTIKGHSTFEGGRAYLTHEPVASLPALNSLTLSLRLPLILGLALLLFRARLRMAVTPDRNSILMDGYVNILWFDTRLRHTHLVAMFCLIDIHRRKIGLQSLSRG